MGSITHSRIFIFQLRSSINLASFPNGLWPQGRVPYVMEPGMNTQWVGSDPVKVDNSCTTVRGRNVPEKWEKKIKRIAIPTWNSSDHTYWRCIWLPSFYCVNTHENELRHRSLKNIWIIEVKYLLQTAYGHRSSSGRVQPADVCQNRPEGSERHGLCFPSKDRSCGVSKGTSSLQQTRKCVKCRDGYTNRELSLVKKCLGSRRSVHEMWKLVQTTYLLVVVRRLSGARAAIRRSISPSDATQGLVIIHYHAVVLVLLVLI